MYWLSAKSARLVLVSARINDKILLPLSGPPHKEGSASLVPSSACDKRKGKASDQAAFDLGRISLKTQANAVERAEPHHENWCPEENDAGVGMFVRVVSVKAAG